MGVSGCDAIIRSGGSVLYDVTWLSRGMPAIPSTSYNDVIKPVGVVSVETSGYDAVTMETTHTHTHTHQVIEVMQNCNECFFLKTTKKPEMELHVG